MNFIKAIWELALPLPTPWRFVLLVGGGVIIAYQLVRRILPLALWPEFLITDRLRRFGLRPLPGTYVFGDLIVWLLKNLRRLTKVALWLVALSFCAWYARPYVADTAFAQYIDKGIEWWDLFEQRILTNESLFRLLVNSFNL